MSNIFEGLDKVSDEVMIGQVALLELIKNNFSIPILDKANLNVHKLTTFLNDLVGNSSKEEDNENQEIYDFLENTKKENKILPRAELVTKLTERIKIKVGFSTMDNPSLDTISNRVIDAAASLFGISLLELPSVKANRISELIYDYIIENTEKFRSEKHIKSSRKLFSNTFRNFGDEGRDKIIELLTIEENIMIAPSYRRTKGSSIIDKEILAIIVYVAVLSLGGSLLIKPDILLEHNISDEEVKYNKLVRKNNNSAFIKVANTKKIIILDNLINEKKLKAEKEINKNKDSKIKISQLKKMKEKLENDLEIATKNVIIKEMELAKYSDELDEIKTMRYQKALFDATKEKEELLTKLKFTINSLSYIERVLERTGIESEDIKNAIEDFKEKITELKIENNSIDNTKDDVLNKLNEEGNKRKTRIIETWGKYFSNFTIDNNVYTQVLEFDYKELKYVELSLFELYNTSDLLSLSQGLTEESHNYMVVNSLNRSPLKITYEVINDELTRGRIVEVEKIPLF